MQIQNQHKKLHRPLFPTELVGNFYFSSKIAPGTPRVQPKSQINGNMYFLIKFHSNLCPGHILTLLKPFRIGFVFFRVSSLLGCTLGVPGAIFGRKIKVSN